MRVMLDINIILDVLLARPQHLAASEAVWAAVEKGAAEGMLSAHAVTTIHYLIRKQLETSQAKRTVMAMLGIFGVAAVNGAVIRDALESSAPDFEDAVTASAARFSGCDLIVTRDPSGFRKSAVRVLTPAAAIPLLAAR